jgi:PAS domain S-box-containing protein
VSTEREIPPSNVLVVDDHVENRIAIRAMLASPNYRIVEASSGPEALLRLLEDDFALLLVDVVMPGMSGLELARAVKQRGRTASIPIIFLTGHAVDSGLVQKGYSAGSVDYLIKPLVPDVVRAKVAVFAELHRQRRRLEEQSRLLLAAARRDVDLGLAELRLASERRYRLLADAVPHIVWTARPDGRLDYVNRRWFEYTGLSTPDAAGSWDVALAPEDRERCREAWNRSIATGEMFEGEARLRRGLDGEPRWHLCRALPERGPSGGIVSWLGTFTDIEDRKRAQLEREQLYQQAVDAVRARDEFLSVASHELRTPLSSLKLGLQLLIQNGDESPGKARAKLEMAARQVERLTRLVGTLFDVSRITAGRLDLELEDTDLAAIVRDVAARSADEAARAGTALDVTTEDTVPGRWDRARIEQIVTNLFSNALKFCAGKPVEVRVTRHGDRAQLTVRDHGVGIAPDDLGRIFERYEQASGGRHRGGLGLGLYIARQLVEAHGGTIRAESTIGDGSAFFVELPLRPKA